MIIETYDELLKGVILKIADRDIEFKMNKVSFSGIGGIKFSLGGVDMSKGVHNNMLIFSELDTDKSYKIYEAQWRDTPWDKNYFLVADEDYEDFITPSWRNAKEATWLLNNIK